MADYWIRDAEGRVLGPVGLGVIGDLMKAGRLTGISQVSRDGQSWSPVAQVPELLQATAPQPAADRRAGERAQAQKLLAQLEALRVRPAHEVFKVERDAPLETYREGFFKISKKFHPDVVPADVDPELRQACAVAYRFFSGLMARVENDRRPPLRVVAPAPPPPPVPERPRAPAVSYDPEAYVGLKQLGPGQAQARIKVTRQNAGMFTDHPLINLKTNGFFLADERVLPLGTQVALTLNFEEPVHTIIARGKVTWEDAGRGHSPHGFGITFQDLSPADRDYLRDFVQRLQAAKSLRQAHS